jgi:hypothetical protein
VDEEVRSFVPPAAELRINSHNNLLTVAPAGRQVSVSYVLINDAVDEESVELKAQSVKLK